MKKLIEGLLRFEDLETGVYVLKSEDEEYQVLAGAEVRSALKQVKGTLVALYGQVEENPNILMTGRKTLKLESLEGSKL